MVYANNYRGLIPYELYVELQNKFPQAKDESDTLWLERVKRDPTLAQKMFGTAEFRTELMQAVAQRTMAQAGAVRLVGGEYKKGRYPLIKFSMPQGIIKERIAELEQAAKVPLVQRTTRKPIAERYAREFMLENTNQYKYATEAYDLLLEQFDASTPENGSIFWNGINELALAKLVDHWNSKHGSELFGQLEATTAARYVNKQFVWGGKFEKYFIEVSGRLGLQAKGHVTAVVRCGLRHDSIFTTKELPNILEQMKQQIEKNMTPNVTDLTIVVIEPWDLNDQPIKTFTNKDITFIPIVCPAPGKRFIDGRNSCTKDRLFNISETVWKYWSERGPKPESWAAINIVRDFKDLTKWP